MLCCHACFDDDGNMKWRELHSLLWTHKIFVILRLRTFIYQEPCNNTSWLWDCRCVTDPTFPHCCLLKRSWAHFYCISSSMISIILTSYDEISANVGCCYILLKYNSPAGICPFCLKGRSIPLNQPQIIAITNASNKCGINSTYFSVHRFLLVGRQAEFHMLNVEIFQS